jgi:acyl-CoA synthetase (NDP forming)
VSAGAIAAGEAEPRTQGLSALFHPRSVAVIGASADKSKIGGRPIHHLLTSGFQGPIYPINPSRDEVQGLRCHPSLAAVGADVDLAIVAVPTPAVLDAVRECATAGVRVAILFSAGFAEMGPEGAALQREVVAVAAAAGMRIVGPNCIGAANMAEGAATTFAFAVQIPLPEGDLPRVALVSQSGAIGGHCVALAPRKGFQFDPWVTTGNESDVDIADCLAYLAMDDEVPAIAVYMEGCQDGDRLRAALELAKQRRKPVIMLKAGRTEAGAAAAASHTASLVGSSEAYDALFRKYNVCRVESITELVDMAATLAVGRLPAGRRVGIVTGSGGAGILMADAAIAVDLEIPPLPEDTQRRLKELWPAASVVNPIDTTAQVTNDPALLSAFLDTILDDSDYDVVLLFLTYLGMKAPWSDNLVASLQKVRATHPEANIVVSMLATDEVTRTVRELGMPVFEELTDAVRTVARLADLAAGFEAGIAPVAPAAAPAVRLSLDEPLTESAAKGVLAAAGIPVVTERVAHSADEAVAAAREVGLPVAMKIESKDIAHKSEVGGVVLDVATDDDVRSAYARIVDAVTGAVPEAEIAGVLVAPMVTDGVETILGVANDPSLGPLVMFGLGGVFVEVLGDVSYRLAPFDAAEAEAMVREVKGFALLDGARGRPRCDVAVLAEALSRLSVFAADNADRIDSVDINPFLVLPEGQGAVAVDALIAPRTSPA